MDNGGVLIRCPCPNTDTLCYNKAPYIVYRVPYYNTPYIVYTTR